VARLLNGPAITAGADTGAGTGVGAAADPAANIDPKASCTLRIIQITDVYVLDYFPHLRNLIKEKRAELAASCGGKTISMLTGDFLAPYLLSSMDNGVGMMRMCNGTPIDYLTWGNHEDDVGHKEVMKREKEYTGTWINTNMTSHESFKGSKCQVETEVIELTSVDGTNKRRLGMMGILSSSPSLYRPNAFGGAKIEDPWETMRKFDTKLKQEHHCDAVLPLCHLYEPQDERTCKEFDFPLVLSGHDHHVVDREINGTRLLKPGQDGINAWMIDMVWPTAFSDSRPIIKTQLLTVKDWPADPELAAVAEKSYSILDPLRKTELAKVPSQYRPLSSFGSRGKRVSMGTYLLSRIRDAMNMDDAIDGDSTCDCAMLKGGNVRGGRDYKDDEHVSLEVLQSELEERKEVVVIPVPGMILRGGLRETFGVPNPGWMQYDDGVILDEDGFVTHIGGTEIDLARVYKVASISDFWRKRDAPTIGAYFEVHPHLLPSHDVGRPIHALLMRLFAVQIWARLWKRIDPNKEGVISEEGFRKLDADGDGQISREELKTAISEIGGLETFAGNDVVVDQMFEEMTRFKNGEGENPHAVNSSELAAAYKHWSSSSLASLVDAEDTDDDKRSTQDSLEDKQEAGG